MSNSTNDPVIESVLDLGVLEGDDRLRADNLLRALIKAHQRAAKDNDNLSKIVLINVAVGSLNFTQSLASAILSTGGLHAPIAAVRALLRNVSREEIRAALCCGQRIPGLGNSFFKGTIDPAFQEVGSIIQWDYPEWHAKIVEISNTVQECGKPVHPNAAMYTAAVCEIVGLPLGAEILPFVLARAPLWTAEYAKATSNLKLMTHG